MRHRSEGGDLVNVSLQHVRAFLEFVPVKKRCNWCEARVTGRRIGADDVADGQESVL